MKAVVCRGACAAAALFASAFLAPQASAQMLIRNLSDVPFGNVGNSTSDLSLNQNVCISAPLTGYRITATGSGTSNSFTLANGSQQMAYDVRWAFTGFQTTGTLLQSGVSTSGYSAILSDLTCVLGLGASASLIVTLKASNYNAATAGSYSGTLTLLIAPV